MHDEMRRSGTPWLRVLPAVGGLRYGSTASNGDLADAYQAARQVTRTASRSFYLSTLLLPREKRRAIQALYAFLRASDDLVDGDSRATPAALACWRVQSRQAAPAQRHPVLRAWADVRDCHGVPQALAEELLDGVAMDFTRRRYATFAELARYCYQVASTVGLMSLPILGCLPGRAAEAAPYAARLGLAMQLTNILRDVGEDARAGRIYLPAEELAAAGCREADLLTGTLTPAVRLLLDRQIARATALYDASLPGIALLAPDSRFAVAAAAAIYRAILPKIVANGYDVFTRRAHLSLGEKVCLLPDAWQKARRLGARV